MGLLLLALRNAAHRFRAASAMALRPAALSFRFAGEAVSLACRCAAHRFLCAAAIRLRAAALRVRLLGVP